MPHSLYREDKSLRHFAGVEKFLDNNNRNFTYEK